MFEDEQDEATIEKILEAAEKIQEMARIRPDEAPAMLEKARHLIELAEQIRRDIGRRKNLEGAMTAPTPVDVGQNDGAARSAAGNGGPSATRQGRSADSSR